MDMIRQAREEDLPRLVAMGAEFFAMSPYAEIFPYSADSTERTLRAVMANPDACLLVWDDGEVGGAIMGCVAPMYMNISIPCALELAWFIPASKRGGAAALRLMKAFEHWASEMGCAFIVMSALQTNLGVARLYERCGYKPHESSYLKGL